VRADRERYKWLKRGIRGKKVKIRYAINKTPEALLFFIHKYVKRLNQIANYLQLSRTTIPLTPISFYNYLLLNREQILQLLKNFFFLFTYET